MDCNKVRENVARFIYLYLGKHEFFSAAIFFQSWSLARGQNLRMLIKFFRSETLTLQSTRKSRIEAMTAWKLEVSVRVHVQRIILINVHVLSILRLPFHSQVAVSITLQMHF